MASFDIVFTMCKFHKVGYLIFVFLIVILRMRVVECDVSAINNIITNNKNNDNGYSGYYRNSLWNFLVKDHGPLAYGMSLTRYRQQQYNRHVIQQYAEALRQNVQARSLFFPRATPISDAKKFLREQNYGQWARNVMDNYVQALMSNTTSVTLFSSRISKPIQKHHTQPTPFQIIPETAMSTSKPTPLDIISTQNPTLLDFFPGTTISKQTTTTLPASIENTSITLFSDNIDLNISTTEASIQNYTRELQTSISPTDMTTTIQTSKQMFVDSYDFEMSTSIPSENFTEISFGVKDSISSTLDGTRTYSPIVTGGDMSLTSVESVEKTTPVDPTSIPAGIKSTIDVIQTIGNNAPTNQPDMYKSSVEGKTKKDDIVGTITRANQTDTTSTETPFVFVDVNGTTRSPGIAMNDSEKVTFDRTNINATDLNTVKDINKPVFAKMTAKENCSNGCVIEGICQNGGTCVDMCDGTGFTCSCLPGYTGYFCNKTMK